MKDIQENAILEAKIEDAVNRSKIMGNVQFLGFLDPTEQETCEKILKNDKEIQFSFFGGHPYCERRIVSIHLLNAPIVNICEWPITPLHLYQNFKKKELKHADILGKLLSLGINRDKVGDIDITTKRIQIFIRKELDNYIINNLDRVSTISVQAKKIIWSQVIPYQSPFVSKNIVAASLRLDAVISKQFHISRKKSVLMIKMGKVKVNWKLIYNSSFILKEKDVISVRGKGRTIIHQIAGKTKKGNIKIITHKN